MAAVAAPPSDDNGDTSAEEDEPVVDDDTNNDSKHDVVEGPPTTGTSTGQVDDQESTTPSTSWGTGDDSTEGPSGGVEQKSGAVPRHSGGQDLHGHSHGHGHGHGHSHGHGHDHGTHGPMPPVDLGASHSCGDAVCNFMPSSDALTPEGPDAEIMDALLNKAINGVYMAYLQVLDKPKLQPEIKRKDDVQDTAAAKRAAIKARINASKTLPVRVGRQVSVPGPGSLPPKALNQYLRFSRSVKSKSYGDRQRILDDLRAKVVEGHDFNMAAAYPPAVASVLRQLDDLVICKESRDAAEKWYPPSSAETVMAQKVSPQVKIAYGTYRACGEMTRSTLRLQNLLLFLRRCGIVVRQIEPLETESTMYISFKGNPVYLMDSVALLQLPHRHDPVARGAVKATVDVIAQRLLEDHGSEPTDVVEVKPNS